MATHGAAPGERRGGRKKGALNRDRKALVDRIQAVCPGYDPVVAMAVIACNEEIDLSIRMTAHKEVAQYVAPKLKAIEHSSDPENPPRIVVTWSNGE